MTDEGRLKKLTELAERVWPGRELFIEDDGAAAVRDAKFMAPLMMVVDHPRALDALEAALSVLAGQQPFARFLEANVRLGSAVADYRTVLINIRDTIRVKYLDERPFDDTALELGTLRHLVVVLWKALESTEKDHG